MASSSKYLSKFILQLVIITVLICPQESLGRVNQHLIAKRDSSSEDILIKAIEEIATTIPLTRYESDPLLFQAVDSANSQSTYRDPQSEQVFYERGSTDRNKAVIVLSSAEDKLSFNGTKREFIVLRSSKLEGTPVKYYPSIVFLL